VTPAMQKTIDETTRRRAVQVSYNSKHGITPTTIKKAIRSGLENELKARRVAQEAIRANEGEFDQTEIIRLLEDEMLEAARGLEFERAAQLRDKIRDLRKQQIC
jgi:excinuclease ABC subunit B